MSLNRASSSHQLHTRQNDTGGIRVLASATVCSICVDPDQAPYPVPALASSVWRYGTVQKLANLIQIVARLRDRTRSVLGYQTCIRWLSHALVVLMCLSQELYRST